MSHAVARVRLPSFPDLAGQVAVVTGAAQGMGARFAEGLLEQGVTVVAADRNEEQLQQTVRAQSTLGAISPATLDVTDGDRVRSLAERVCDEHGRLDIWVNNAGVFPRADVFSVTAEHWDATQAVNVKGVFLGAQAAAEQMSKTGGGAIVNMASIAGYKARPTRVAYCASKAAVEHLTHCLALELGPLGIRVNAIAPGFIETPMLDWLQAEPETKSRALETIPLRRFGNPDDVVGLVLFLVSDAARYITGHTLAVDGGVRYA